jgi:hypothetical protein
MGIPAPGGGTQPTIPAGDKANYVVQGQFAVPGVTPWAPFYGAFNFAVWGTTPTSAWTGSVQLERSFDGGVTPLICGIGGAGQPAIYSGATLAGNPVNVVASEPELGMLYRLNCTALSAGAPLNYRLSASGLAAMAWGVPSG